MVRSVKDRRRAVQLAALAACAAVCTACSSSSGGPSDAKQASDSGVSAPNPSSARFSGTYKLMVIGPFSTGGSEESQPEPEIAVGAQAAAARINAAGGINGKSITIVKCDSQGVPNMATQCAHSAAGQGVLAVVGALDTGGEYLSELQYAGIPAIAPYAIAEELLNPISYSIFGGVQATAGAISLLKAQEIKDIALVYPDTPGKPAQMAKLIPAMDSATGAHITGVPIEPDAPDLSPVVAEAASHAGIVLFTNSDLAIAFIHAAQQAGVTRPISSTTGTLTLPAIKSLGSAADGTNVVDGFLPASDTSNAGVAAFDRWMNAIDPSATKDDVAENAYSGVEIFADLAKGMTDVTPQALIQALNRVSGLTLSLGPVVDFTRNYSNLPGYTRMFDPNVFFDKIEGGTLVPTSDKPVNAFTGAVVTG